MKKLEIVGHVNVPITVENVTTVKISCESIEKIFTQPFWLKKHLTHLSRIYT